jgi:hypothetical protein
MARAIPLFLVLALAALTARAAPDGWHQSLDDGKKAARVSGKPILVVTAWAPNI